METRLIFVRNGPSLLNEFYPYHGELDNKSVQHLDGKNALWEILDNLLRGQSSLITIYNYTW